VAKMVFPWSKRSFAPATAAECGSVTLIVKSAAKAASENKGGWNALYFRSLGCTRKRFEWTDRAGLLALRVSLCSPSGKDARSGQNSKERKQRSTNLKGAARGSQSALANQAAKRCQITVSIFRSHTKRRLTQCSAGWRSRAGSRKLCSCRDRQYPRADGPAEDRCVPAGTAQLPQPTGSRPEPSAVFPAQSQIAARPRSLPELALLVVV
jgi:hypothetical protein